MNPVPDIQSSGLSQSEAEKRLQRYGPNLLPEPRRPGLLKLFLHQFKSPFIYVLLAAALVSLALGQNINSAFIMAVLLLNAVIGTVQEYAAERAASGLRKMVPHRATVLRDGVPVQVDTGQIVPGDIVLLVSGDKVAADLRLSQSLDLEIDESMLTGESMSSRKDANIRSTDDMPLGDRADIAYAGTIVLRGRGRGEVIATGIHTQIGRIARDVIADEQTLPPLVQRIQGFTRRISWSIAVLIGLIFIITVLRGDDLSTVFLLGVALAVSAIPEGLPVAITVALAIGMKRMARVGVIIRNLVAVESLGSCTCIASDKTGTLTVNELTIRELVLANGGHYSVSGEGLDMHGVLSAIRQKDEALEQQAIKLLLDAGVLANEARLEQVEDEWRGYGDQVDIAFLVLMNKAGEGVEAARKRYAQIESIPYESHRAYAASLNHYEDHIELFVKGSVEKLLPMCDSIVGGPADLLKKIERRAVRLAGEGYRVLALAHRRLDRVPDSLESELHDMAFIGLVAMIDPLRPDVIDAVSQCREASIRVVMITGDHPQTAQVLAKELGIARRGVGREYDAPVTGMQLKQAGEAGEAAFDALVARAQVFARVEPHQKMLIVESMIRQGEFVAVTGDGVNDAPALKHAHVGIAMGKRGSDVARESSDLILTDDNFSSIVQGIRQGRIVYNNIRKVIFLLISTGAAEITLVILSILLGLPLPLMPLQLLWLNLVTNGIQDVALVFEPAEGDELKKPPRKPGEPVFNRLMLERVIINALVMGCIAFSVFYWQILQGVAEDSARNITLLLMVLFENVHVFNSRSETVSVFRQKFFGNPLLLFGMLAAQAIHIIAMHTPGLSDILMLQPVSLETWSRLLSIALLLILVDELHKLWHRRRSRSR